MSIFSGAAMSTSRIFGALLSLCLVSGYAQEPTPQNQSAEQFAARLQKLLDSRDYKRSSAILAIAYENSVIALLTGVMNRQKKIGEESGFVDKSTMYGAASALVDAKDRKRAFISSYKSAGGKAKTLDVTLEEIVNNHRSCMQSHGAEPEALSEAVTNMNTISLTGQPRTSLEREDQLAAMYDIVKCF